MSVNQWIEKYCQRYNILYLSNYRFMEESNNYIYDYLLVYKTMKYIIYINIEKKQDIPKSISYAERNHYIIITINEQSETYVKKKMKKIILKNNKITKNQKNKKNANLR